MKKQLLIIFSLIFLVGKMPAQLTLDHTFTESVSPSFPYVEEPIGYYYTTNNGTIYLYNSDYSLYKTVSLNLPSGYYNVSAANLGKHIVNTDEKIEFFVYGTYTSQNTYQIAMIINEDGNIIQELGQANTVSWYMYKVGSQLRFNFVKLYYDAQSGQSHVETEVYICHGNYNAVASFEDKNTAMQPYPNPTTTLINLPYHIEKGTISTINIYNIYGQLVGSYNIGGDFEKITINVNNYAKGIYVYEYNGISNRFIVQ